MSKKITEHLFICLLLTITGAIIVFSDQVIEAVSFSLTIWTKNLFPSLFPFFVVSNLLLQYGFVDVLSHSIGRIMPRLFSQPKQSSFVLAISLISGFPSGAKYTKELWEKKLITTEEASRLLSFTHYSNPLFILGMIGSLLLGNIQLGVILLFSHVASGIMVGCLVSKRDRNYQSKSYILPSSTSRPSLGGALTNSIQDAVSTLFLLLGIVTVFLVLSTILEQVFTFDPYLKAIICGILEMTQGVKYMSALPISELAKLIWMGIFTSFGGLSVHMQVLSILSGSKIKYKYFFFSRLLHALICAILVSILYLFII